MRRDNAARGNWAGMFRRGLIAVGKHVFIVASASRSDSEGAGRDGVAARVRAGRVVECRSGGDGMES